MPASPRDLPDLFALDRLLSDEELQIRSAVRDLVDDLVRPQIRNWYQAGGSPARELMSAFGAAGLLGMHLTGYGCAGTSGVAYGLACLELEAGDSGIRSLVSVQGSLVMYPIHRYGSDEQKDRWLPGLAAGELIGCFGLTESDSGSDPGSMRTRAVRTADGFVLDGAKMWISNGTVADVALIWAVLTEDDRPRVRGFLVPTTTPGFTARPIGYKLSLRASDTAEIVLDDVHLPHSAMLPEAHGLGAPLSALAQARTGIAFGALGAARDCLAVTLDYTANRTQFGRPLAGFQLTQAKLADMATAWTAAYLMALHLGWSGDEAAGLTESAVQSGGGGRSARHRARSDRPAPTVPAPAAAAVSMAKLNSTRTALDIARTCRTLLGANGITGDYPVMRHAANLETVLTYEGTAEIHQLVLGRTLTGVDAFGAALG